MYYIWIIARRQFTENIISLRLFIGLIICLALFVSSTYVLMSEYNFDKNFTHPNAKSTNPGEVSIYFSSLPNPVLICQEYFC